MQDEIWTFEPTTAIEHIEGNLYGFWRFCGAYEDRILFADGRLTWVSSHPYAMPNLIFDPRLEGVDLDEYLPGLVTRIRQGDCPKTWVRGHDDGPPGLYERLAGLGFVEVARRPTMAISLRHPQCELEPIQELIIHQLHGEADLDEWLSIVSTCFMAGRDPGRELFARHLLPSDRIALYLARLHGTAVGTALVFLDGRVAGLHLVGVSEPYRRRGIAARLTLRALADATRAGYRAAVLKASQLGESIYRRLGFLGFSRLMLYEWKG